MLTAELTERQAGVAGQKPVVSQPLLKRATDIQMVVSSRTVRKTGSKSVGGEKMCFERINNFEANSSTEATAANLTPRTSQVVTSVVTRLMPHHDQS